MSLNYKDVGLKCGIEVHQQLDVGKLFCRCASELREEEPDFTFRRKLRASAGELGEFDQAALEAMKKDYSYVYEAYNDTTCLVECDEEPVRPLNKDALHVILEVACLADSRILDEFQVMRKTVVDGSNTSGFQRTMLVAVGGKIKLEKKELGIQSLILEEDAARPTKKDEGKREIHYRIDRLGIPLIELATEPDIESPEMAKEAALKIGELFRITGKAKRGLGTIRQDLNISIAEGARVELKGVQELEMIDTFVEREIERQLKLMELKGEMEKRGIKENDFGTNRAVDLGNCLAKTNSVLVLKAIAKGTAFGVKLPKMKGLLGFELQPDRRFGTEVSSYVKARAGLNGIIHCDELPNYGITEAEAGEIRKELGCASGDGFALVLGERENCIDAVEVIKHRCALALKEVPNETRNALEGGNSEYSRPLPGAARMYPETDSELVKPDKKEIAEIRKNPPMWAEQRKARYLKWGLSEKLAEEMKLSNYARFFEEMVGKGHSAVPAATLLLETLTQLKREGTEPEKISNEMIESVLEGQKSGRITREILIPVLAKWGNEKHKNLDTILAEMNMKIASDEEARGIIAGIVKRNSALVKEKKERAAGALMGEAMKELAGKLPGKTISRILSEEIFRELGDGK